MPSQIFTAPQDDALDGWVAIFQRSPPSGESWDTIKAGAGEDVGYGNGLVSCGFDPDGTTANLYYYNRKIGLLFDTRSLTAAGKTFTGIKLRYNLSSKTIPAWMTNDLGEMVCRFAESSLNEPANKKVPAASEYEGLYLDTSQSGSFALGAIDKDKNLGTGFFQRLSSAGYVIENLFNPGGWSRYQIAFADDTQGSTRDDPNEIYGPILSGGFLQFAFNAGDFTLEITWDNDAIQATPPLLDRTRGIYVPANVTNVEQYGADLVPRTRGVSTPSVTGGISAAEPPAVGRGLVGRGVFQPSLDLEGVFTPVTVSRERGVYDPSISKAPALPGNSYTIPNEILFSKEDLNVRTKVAIRLIGDDPLDLSTAREIDVLTYSRESGGQVPNGLQAFVQDDPANGIITVVGNLGLDFGSYDVRFEIVSEDGVFRSIHPGGTNVTALRIL